MNELDNLNHANLSDTVYAALCDALIKGQFQPGSRLKIRDLAAQLGTSVTPVRDAILRLSHDDAIVFLSSRNMQIPYLKKERYLEIRTIRLKLEALAAETAASMATAADIISLSAILEKNEKALEEDDHLAGAELNQAFHFKIATIAGLPTLHGILRRLWLQMGPLIAHAYPTGKRRMIDHHYSVVEALRQHNPKAAADAIVSDIMDSGKLLIETIDRR